MPTCIVSVETGFSIGSIGQLRVEVAAALRAHVQKAPDRVDEIAGAVVLAEFLRRIEYFAAPEMADGAVGVLALDVVHRLVPVLAGLVAAFRTHRRPELRRVPKI